MAVETLMSTTEVAQLARVSGDTVRWQTRQGYLKPAVQSGSGIRLYTEAEVRRWIEQRQTRRAR